MRLYVNAQFSQCPKDNQDHSTTMKGHLLNIKKSHREITVKIKYTAHLKIYY